MDYVKLPRAERRRLLKVNKKYDRWIKTINVRDRDMQRYNDKHKPLEVVNA